MLFPLDRHFGLYEDLGFCVSSPLKLCVCVYVRMHSCIWRSSWDFVCVHAHSACERLLVTFSQCCIREEMLQGSWTAFSGRFADDRRHSCVPGMLFSMGLDELQDCLCYNIYQPIQIHKGTLTLTHSHIPCVLLFSSCMLNALVMDPLNDQLSRPLTPRGVC